MVIDEDDGIQPAIGDRLTYVSDDGDEFRALCISPVIEDEYVTLAIGADGELGKEYQDEVETLTSVYVHASEGEQYTAEGHAFKLGWS